MGRPIKKKFIKTSQPHHLVCTGWPVGAVSATTCTIVSQKGFQRYKITDGTHTSVCKLVTGAPSAAGQMSITVKPYVAPTSAASVVVHMQVDTATVVAIGSGYAATDTVTLADGAGTHAVITVDTVNGGGGILTYHVSTTGNFTSLPTNPVSQGSTSGVGVGATFNLKYKVLSAAVTGGTGYGSTIEVVFNGGGFTTQATGTNTPTAGVPASTITITNTGNGYTSIPSVSLLSFGTIEYANKVMNRTVETFQDHKYKWELNGSTLVGTGTPNGATSQGTGTLAEALIQSV